MKWIAVMLILAAALLAGCASASTDTSESPSVQESTLTTADPESETMINEEEKVLAAYETMQQAMIDKDIDKLDRIIKDGTTFTHMSGKTQTKEEYFGEIADGTLNYYKYKIADCKIAVNGDTATLTANVTLTAKVYGMSGSWTLPVNAHFEKINNKWIYTN